MVEYEDDNFLQCDLCGEYEHEDAIDVTDSGAWLCYNCMEDHIVRQYNSSCELIEPRDRFWRGEPEMI